MTPTAAKAGHSRYRLHVKVASTPTDLALYEWLISSAVAGFTNGVQLFHVGQVAPFVPYSSNEPLINRIPADQIATGSVVIALRVHISSADWNSVQPGFVSYNLRLGQEDALRDQRWIHGVGGGWLPFLDLLIFLGLGIAAILIYSAQTRRREYIWLTLLCACNVLSDSQLLASFLRNIPVHWLSLYLVIDFTAAMAAILMYLAFISKTHSRLLVRFRRQLASSTLLL